MTKKPHFAKKRHILLKPDKCTILGSSNNKRTHKLANFCLPTTNKSRSGAHSKVGVPNNYLNQVLGTTPYECLEIDKRSVHILLLSFNYLLFEPSDIHKLHLTFIKNVLILLRVLSENGLNLQNNLIVLSPPIRFFDTSTHKIQLDEITKLGEKLIQKRIFFVNTYELLPKDLKEKNYFCRKKVDGFHYSDEVIKSISLIAADSLKKFLDSKF